MQSSNRSRYLALKARVASPKLHHHTQKTKKSITAYKALEEWYEYLKDSVHDSKHALDVGENAATIYETMSDKDDLPSWFSRALFLASLFHDVRDHKHQDLNTNMVTESTLNEFLLREIIPYTKDETEAKEALQTMLSAIFRSSWSKRHQTKEFMTSANIQTILMIKILQDADWVEALGVDGIRRANEWTLLNNPTATPEFMKNRLRLHTDEKLALIPDSMNFECSREKGRQALLPILDYIK